VRGGEHQGIELPVRRRHHHDPALDAGDLGRQRVHEHRGGIGRGAAGHVEAGGGDRGPALADAQARRVGVVEVGGHLAPVVRLDARRGELEGLQDLARNARRGRSQLGLGDAQGLRRQAGSVEALGVLDQRRVAAGAHLCQDLGDRIGHVRLGVALGGQ
jgi:hypothetical protein